MTETKERFILLDIIKIFAFYAIVCYHFFNDFWYGQDDIFLTVLSPSPGAAVARFFCINFQSAGFVLSFICLALVGFRRYSTERLTKLSFILLGAFLVYDGFMFFTSTDFVYWDFIPLLITALFFTVILNKLNLPTEKIQIAMSIMLIYPFWELSQPGQSIIVQALIGTCRGWVSSWSFFPWFGFVTLALGLGSWAGRHRERLRRAKAWEIPVITFALCLFVPAFLTYNQNQVTSEWECLAFRQGVIIFLMLLVGIIALCRISLLDVTNRVLTLIKLNLVSRLKIAQNTGVAYLLHFIPISLMSAAVDSGSLEAPMASVYVVLTAFLFPELVLRLVPQLDRHRHSRSK